MSSSFPVEERATRPEVARRSCPQMDTRIDMHFTVLLDSAVPRSVSASEIGNRESGNCFLHVLMDGSLLHRLKTDFVTRCTPCDRIDWMGRSTDGLI